MFAYFYVEIKQIQLNSLELAFYETLFEYGEWGNDWIGLVSDGEEARVRSE